ncbi:MAG: winged helix-turn-helix transcriptional regulator [Candidatus Thalassarchaeaceae archaeon]|nr:winged helix-turn-helix transcriptional regulator [Candidatus Thalassarchaeaceae archaeon]
MRGIIGIRIIFFFGVFAILSGILIQFNAEVNYPEQESGVMPASMAADSDEIIEKIEYSQKDDQSNNLIFTGIGILFTLLLAGTSFEFFKVLLLVSLLIPIVSKRNNSEDDILNRGRILGYLEANAGINFSALRDGLGLANGVSAYHLNLLESNGQIISWRDGKLRRYAISSLSQEEVKLIQNPIIGTRLAILEVLGDSGNMGISGPEIRSKLSISRQLLSHHMLELRKNNLVSLVKESKRPRWQNSNEGNKLLTISKEIKKSD